jgi:hypothetical protein
MTYECVFFVVASTASLLFGIGAGWMFETDPPPKHWSAWMWVRQFWLNYLGSFAGWICLWLLTGRISIWIASGCENAPGVWEMFLFIVTFIGMTGHLPLASVRIIEDLSGWLKRAAKIDKPA